MGSIKRREGRSRRDERKRSMEEEKETGRGYIKVYGMIAMN